MKGSRCLWHSCLLTGLVSGAAVAADLGTATSTSRVMTIEEFKAQVAAERAVRPAGAAPARPTSGQVQNVQRPAAPRAAGASRTGVVMTVDEFISMLGQEAQDTTSRTSPATESPTMDRPRDSQENTDNDTDSTASAVANQAAGPLEGEGISMESVPSTASSSEVAPAATTTAAVPLVVERVDPVSEPISPVAASERRNSQADRDRAAQLLAAAGIASTMDVNTAVRQAMLTHPSIAESLGMLYSTLEEVDVARAGYFPRVSSAIGSGYRHSNSNAWDSFSISASQMLYDFGKVSSSVDAATSNAERNRAGVLLAMDELARNTADAFIEVQRYQALLEIAKEQTAAIAEIQELAEQRSQLGASSRSDVLQALSRHEAALATELQYQAQLDMWKRTLQNYTGRETPVRVDASFPVEFEQACVAEPDDFEKVPRVMAAEAALAEARAKIERAKADFFPTFTLNANYGNLNNPANVAFNPVLNDREFSVALSVDSTLYQGGGITARRRAAEYAVQAAQAGKQAALLEVTRSFREARDQSLSFTERLRYLDARYENVVNTQQLYRQQYLSLGTRTLLDILNTEQEIHQSRFDAQHTLHDLRHMQITCMYSLGKLRDAFGLDSRIARVGER